MNDPLLLQKWSRNRWDERGEKTEEMFSVFSSKKWTVYRTRKKWDFWISGSYNHEEPGPTESITAGIEVVNDEM